jgi:O-acetyl-ADP-ribose deacetylase (regulator of RNase III)
MMEANRHGCLSVSFPSISTGAFRYPLKPAALIAVRAVAGLLHQPGSVRLARFVLFDRQTHGVYTESVTELAGQFPHLQMVVEAVA